MSEPLRLLVAISGAEDPALVGFVTRVVGGEGRAIEVTLLHVLEADARLLAGQGPAMRHAPWPGRSQSATEHRLEEADEAKATALLAAWQERFQTRLPAAAAITSLIRRGRPEQEIIGVTELLQADGIVLSSRPGVGGTQPGPRSVGHVARFVLDRSPVPVLLVRGSPRRAGQA